MYVRHTMKSSFVNQVSTLLPMIPPTPFLIFEKFDDIGSETVIIFDFKGILREYLPLRWYYFLSQTFLTITIFMLFDR